MPVKLNTIKICQQLHFITDKWMSEELRGGAFSIRRMGTNIQLKKKKMLSNLPWQTPFSGQYKPT